MGKHLLRTRRALGHAMLANIHRVSDQWNTAMWQVAMQHITPPLSVLHSRIVALCPHQQPSGVFHTQRDHCTYYEVRLSFVSCGMHLESLRFSLACLLHPISSRIYRVAYSSGHKKVPVPFTLNVNGDTKQNWTHAKRTSSPNRANTKRTQNRRWINIQ